MAPAAGAFSRASAAKRAWEKTARITQQYDVNTTRKNPRGRLSAETPPWGPATLSRARDGSIESSVRYLVNVTFMIDFAAYEVKTPEVARRQRCACGPICCPASVICAKRLSRPPQGGIGVAEPTIGMTLNSRVEESDERPGKPVDIFVFE
jgi:hypothetical protein